MILKNMALCDLRPYITAESIKKIENVAMLIIPADADLEAGIDRNNIVSTIPLKKEDKLVIQNGLSEITSSLSSATVVLANGITVIGGLTNKLNDKLYINGLVIIKKELKNT